MSQAFLTLAFWDWPTHAVHKLLLLIDSGIYWLASEAYQLFVKLSQTRIFEDEFFSNFANRIYAILGVFMLFYLAYALLMALIDPEKFTKGDKGVGKIASNLVISLVIIGFLPSIFTYAYRLQNYVLSSNLIGSLVLGTPLLETGEEDGNNEAMLKYGDVLSFTVLNTFLNPDNINFNMGKTSSNQDYNWFDFKYDVLKNSNYINMSAMSTAVSTGVNPLSGNTGENVVIDYKFPISTIGGVILCFLLITFTLDLGVRVIKFAFYQLIAPIPVIMRIIPGKKGTFDKWLKQTLFVYAEVFIRVGIMYMVIYFINGIANSASMSQFFGEGSGLQGKLAFVIIIMGMLTFAKQAPKMISDMIGIDTGGLKLGIGEKLKAGGFFAGGAALGAAITSGFNPFAIARGWRSGRKDGNFHSIGQEAALRHSVLNARENGSSWMGRRYEDVRKYFGFNNAIDAENRRIENMRYLDDSGHAQTHTENDYDAQGRILNSRSVDVDKNYIDRRKLALKNIVAEVDESVRRKKAEVEQNENLRKASQEVMDKAKEAIQKTDSKVERENTDYGYGSIKGNISQMRSFLKQIEETNRPDVEKLKEEFTYYANGANGTPVGYFDEDGYNEKLKQLNVDHSQIISKYQSEIEKLEKDMTLTQIDNVINQPDNKDFKTRQALENLRVVNNGVAATSGTEVKTVRDDNQKIVNKNALEVTGIERQKIEVSREIAELDRIEALHKEQQDLAKQTSRYHAIQANKDSRNSGGK